MQPRIDTKGKIYNIQNTEDSMWFEMHPSDTTIKHLDAIFDIYKNLYDEVAEDLFSYSQRVNSGELSFFKEHPEFFAYFIFTKQASHVLLRKTKEWKRKREEILEYFDFV